MTGPGAPALAVVASKRWGATVALDDAALTVRAGTVHALVGENGAGKSTLVRVAAGEVRADRGAVTLGARPVDAALHSVAAAAEAGVALVAQHGRLVPTLSVVENAVLGREPTRRGLLALAPAAAELEALGRRHGLAVRPAALAGELSVGEQQRAELVIALWRGARVLLLDEPTAALAPVEVAGLLAVLRTLAAAGGAVVLVTHKLDEVVEVADEVTVLRAGRVAGRFARAADGPGFDPAAMVRAMVGGEPPPRVAAPSGPVPGGGPVLEVRGLVVDAPGGRGPALAGVDLAIAPGERVGVAGVEGNGQRELAAALAGLVRPRAGRIALAGADVTAAPVAARLAAGLAVIGEDRHADGLLLDESVEANLALGRWTELGGAVVRPAVRRALAARLVRAFDVRPPDIALPARALSGGNQQKVVVARALTRPGLRALVAAQPTRGVDVAAQAAIHRHLVDAADAGLALLVISADLDELLALCGRVVVLRRGRIAGELAGEALRAPDARAALGAWMTGAEAVA